MEGRKIALKLDAGDNAAVTLADLRAGESCLVRGDGAAEYALTATQDVAFGHKIALADLAADAPVYKYGEEIGRMKEALAMGGWIHSHNMYCERGM